MVLRILPCRIHSSNVTFVFIANKSLAHFKNMVLLVSNALIFKLIELDMQVISTEWTISFTFVLLINPTRTGLFSGNSRVGGANLTPTLNLPPEWGTF